MVAALLFAALLAAVMILAGRRRREPWFLALAIVFLAWLVYIPFAIALEEPSVLKVPTFISMLLPAAAWLSVKVRNRLAGAAKESHNAHHESTRSET